MLPKIQKKQQQKSNLQCPGVVPAFAVGFWSRLIGVIRWAYFLFLDRFPREVIDAEMFAVDVHQGGVASTFNRNLAGDT